MARAEPVVRGSARALLAQSARGSPSSFLARGARASAWRRAGSIAAVFLMLLSALCVALCLSLVLWCQRRLARLRRAASAIQRRGRALAIQEGADARALVAELNELTLELSSELGAPVFVARRSARAALGLGAFFALLELAATLGRARLSLTAPLVAFAAGAGAMIACSAIGRVAERDAREAREQWNGLMRRARRDVGS